MPGWDAGEEGQACTIYAGELDGSAESLILCGHRCHGHYLERWRQSQPGVFREGRNSMPIRCPYCRANDRGSVAPLLPDAEAAHSLATELD
eukprot:2448103-Pyramimonas_sp.AAC.1